MSPSRARLSSARSGLTAIVAATLLFALFGPPPATAPNALAQADANSYVNPTYGYQIAWEPDVWDVVEGGPGDLALTSDLVEIYFQSGQFYAGNATNCRDDLLDRLPDDDNVLSIKPFEGNGEQSGETDGRAYSTLRVELDQTNGQDARTVVERIDCRTVVAGEAVLAITWLAPIDAAGEAVKAADGLLEGLEIPSFRGPEADVAGLQGGTYTDPGLGFALNWDETDWTSFVPVDAIFGLNSTTSLISFSLPDTFDGDAAKCVETTLDDLGGSPGIVDVTPIQIDGEDVAGLDDEDWSYAAIDANYGGAEQFVGVRCAAIPGSGVTLRAVHSGPIDSYEGEAALAAPVFASLTVADAGGNSEGDATPTASAETERAATPSAEQGTPVPEETAATPESSNGSPSVDDAATFNPQTGGWSLVYDGTVWQPLDPAIYATVDLALGGGSSVVTFDATPSDGRDVQEILDGLVEAEIIAPAENQQDVEQLDDPPVPSDGAVGAAYGYVTPGGAAAALGIIVVPFSDDSVVVVRIYATPERLMDDGAVLQDLINGLEI